MVGRARNTQRGNARPFPLTTEAESAGGKSVSVGAVVHPSHCVGAIGHEQTPDRSERHLASPLRIEQRRQRFADRVQANGLGARGSRASFRFDFWHDVTRFVSTADLVHSRELAQEKLSQAARVTAQPACKLKTSTPDLGNSLLRCGGGAISFGAIARAVLVTRRARGGCRNARPRRPKKTPAAQAVGVLSC